jgi:hypothetical protein
MSSEITSRNRIPQYLSVAEVAALLRIDRKTVHKLLASGEISHVASVASFAFRSRRYSRCASPRDRQEESMSVYRDARDGKWRYRKTINLPDRRKLRISGTPPVSTKVGAEAAERKHIERALTSPAGPTPKEVPTFETFAEEFLEKYVAVKNKPSELGTKRSIFRHHLVPFFGAKKLDQIDAELIADYTSAVLKTKKAPKTINNHLTVLRRLLAIALKWGRLHRVPEIDWLKAPKPPYDFLDFSEAKRLVDAGKGSGRR